LGKKFDQWIAEFGGDEKLAWKLGITSAAIKHWRRGTTTPSAKNVFEIIKLSKGALSFGDIVTETDVPKKTKTSK